MLLRGITQGHPFNDGNKRTGFLLATYYLNLVGIRPPAAYDEAQTIALGPCASWS
jgi:prophage maintenance system killer protein